MLPVYTELLRVERRVWHIGRWPLPRPITVPQLLLGILVSLLLFQAIQHGVLPIPRPPFGPLLVGVYLVAGGGAVVASGQPLLDGRAGPLYSKAFSGTPASPASSSAWHRLGSRSP